MSGSDSTLDDAKARFGSGRAVHRVEDGALLAGRGRFVDNVAEPRQAIVAFQRSPYAHTRIVAIDADAGVRAGLAHPSEAHIALSRSAVQMRGSRCSVASS